MKPPYYTNIAVVFTNEHIIRKEDKKITGVVGKNTVYVPEIAYAQNVFFWLPR